MYYVVVLYSSIGSIVVKFRRYTPSILLYFQIFISIQTKPTQIQYGILRWIYWKWLVHRLRLHRHPCIFLPPGLLLLCCSAITCTNRMALKFPTVRFRQPPCCEMTPHHPCSVARAYSTLFSRVGSLYGAWSAEHGARSTEYAVHTVGTVYGVQCVSLKSQRQ